MKLKKINKKGQAGISGLGIAIMVAIFIFLIGMTCINFINDIVTSTRATDQLNCSSNSISDGNKLACLIVDLVIPYFIIIIFSVSGGMITARLLM